MDLIDIAAWLYKLVLRDNLSTAKKVGLQRTVAAINYLENLK